MKSFDKCSIRSDELVKKEVKNCYSSMLVAFSDLDLRNT